jgi:peptidoglycan/xylan/chitin deacetylase (PgdA/CDA1 family)
MRFVWPNGTKCTIGLSVEYDAESVEMGFRNYILGTADRGEFSPRYGVPRILELLAKYDVKATFFVPAWDAERYPKSVKRIAQEGHEVAAHGYIHEDFSKLGATEEKEIFHKAHEILTEIAGSPPRGFRSGAYCRPISPNTLRIAHELGYIYDSSFLDDDEPYQVKIDDNRVKMIEIPWAWVLNDLTFICKQSSPGMGLVLPTRTPAWILEVWKEEFDSLYEEVGFFTLIIHPTEMGYGSRMPLLEGMIRFIKGYPGVWFATYSEIADCCLRQLK